MFYSKKTARIVAGFFLSILFSITQVLATVTDQDSSSFITSNQIKLEPDYHTGSFVYSYPLTIPPGRNKLQPHLSLDYNSGNKDNSSLVGYGWALSLPYIERIARYGSDDLYTKHVFNSSLSGELEDVELTTDPYGTYGAKVDDGSFLKYEYSDDETWTVTDKKGVVYTFGSSDDDKVSDPDDTTHVFRWMLSKIEDPDGNTVTYTYTKDENQVYPSSINYTGHDSDSGIFDIVFTLEARSDTQTSFATGFEVKTNYRVSTIDVQINSETVRSYALSYTTGDNGVRSLLESVTETGTDEEGTSLTKPATTFDYTTSERTWTEDEDFADFPLVIAGTSHGSLGVYLFDVNGDNLPDVVHSRSGKDREVYINNGDKTWTLDSNYSVPFDFAGSSGQDRGVRILDLNGDGYQDLVKSRSTSTSTESVVYINNADGTGWTEDTSISVPFTFTNGSSDFGVRIFDVDGDGMQDLVKARGSDSSDYVYINNGDGTGWTLDTDYTVPVKFATSSRDKGVRMVDVNGDGLIDLVYGRYTSSYDSSLTDSGVYINNGDGTGWTQDTNYTVPEMFIGPTYHDKGGRPFDVNGDGLEDIVYSYHVVTGTTPTYQVDSTYINDGDGTGWTEDTSASVAMWFASSGGYDRGSRELDIDGDGLTDILYSRETTTTTYEQLWIADGGHSDLLNSITHSLGATTSVTYQAQVEQGGKLFFPMQVVSTITTDDGLGNTATITYDFSDADYYYASQYDRKFAGFGKVSVTDAVGNIKIEYYHQGNDTNSDEGESTDDISKIWKPYREEIYDSTSHLYQTTLHTWTSANLGDDRSFVYESQKLELLYDEDDDHTDKATVYTYDEETGNLIEEKDYEKVTGADDASFSDADSTDNVITNYTYAERSDGSFSSYLTSKEVSDASGEVYQQTLWYYDDLDFGLFSDGNPTKESRWVEGSTYAQMAFTYDDYGFCTSVTDPKGNTTSVTPDDSHLYVATKTDPSGYEESFTYDNSSGQIEESTDKNGFVFSRTYDAFDRPVLETIPDPTDSASSVTKTTWSYDDSSVPVSVHQTDSFNSTTDRETYTYFDGFARVIQQRKETGGGSYVVSDTVYDSLGRVEKKSLPYNQTGTSYSSATSVDPLYTTFTYDALSRLTSTTNVRGSIARSYEDFVVTETDRDGKVKTYTYNASNLLVSVGEKMGPTLTFTTTYTWDPAGRLTKITDAENNVRSFTYNGLGNRLTAEDLHQTLDIEFGTWIYSYDDNGNLETSVSPNGITTTYSYDELNRVLTEDADSTSSTDISYEYDTCENGIGRVCTIDVTSGSSTTYTYNALGGVEDESTTIMGTAYSTGYTYDRQSSLIGLTYPDGSKTEMSENNAGEIIQTKFTDVDGTVTMVASNVRYAPNGKVSSINYANGAVSSYNYEMGNLYRLSRATTTLSSTTLEDFTYNYDPTGNITGIVDASGLYDSMTITYNYDDLYRLIGATSTSSSTSLTYSNTWTYGAVGEMLTSELGSYSYTSFGPGVYANPHAPTKIGSVVQSYDKNGNLTNNGVWTNTWNSRNELESAANVSTTVSYQYNQEGKRVYQTSSTGHTSIYPNSYYTIDGNLALRNIPLGSFGMVATSRRPTSGGPSQMVFHHRDHLGGTHVDTDFLGNVLEYIVYKPFGEPLLDTTPSAAPYVDPYKFTGKEKDAETGWYYYDARYYSATSGQFLSEDPVFLSLGTDNKLLQTILATPQKLNSYSYTENNPVSRIDPTGNLSIGAYDPLGIQTLIWRLGSEYFRSYKNYPIASAFMNHSLSIFNHGSVFITESNQSQFGNVINAIRECPEFKTFIQDGINAASSLRMDSFATRPIVFEFYSNEDLRLSIRNVTTTVQGEKTDIGWNFSIHMTDIYDFSPEFTNDFKTSLMVDTATISQSLGVINPYAIDIKFNYSVDDKEKKEK